MLVNFVDIGFLHFIKSCDGKVRRVIRLVDKVANAITFEYFLHFRNCLEILLIIRKLGRKTHAYCNSSDKFHCHSIIPLCQKEDYEKNIF